MGRHRRSGAAPAAEDYAAGTDRRHRGDRRRRSVRNGLLSASAAVAVGAVAVTSGLLPGGDVLTVGSTGTAERQTQSPSQSRQAPELTTQGGATETPAGTGASTRTGTGTGKPAAPSAKPSAAPSKKPSAKPTAKPSAEPSAKPSKTTASPSAKPKPKATPSSEPKPEVTKTAAPKKAAPEPAAPKTSAAPTTEAPAPKPDPTTQAPTRRAAAASTASRGDAAEAEILRLVNAERATVGCTPVNTDARLASLAGAFSADMAARGFFDHTDPDGDTPWTRAQQAGVSTLAGENIARGQTDAAAVMKSWMNSDGHRANILNCDFKTMGVGVHFGDGGPWWTQDFGY
ncbi:CAP domain-containing protein [Streptomyces sp. NPDC098101]|uniref:CAP domain-containing protein n=1 Tax=Streptomyces sp. NPDC098101 TaxID=3366096 RepID=UPI0038167C1F